MHGAMVAQVLGISEEDARALIERAQDGDEAAVEQLQDVRRRIRGE